MISSRDYFRPDVLLCVNRTDTSTYLRAVEHFFGIRLSPGEGSVFGATIKPRSYRPTVSEDDEFRLAMALLADAHEKCHFEQFTSTSAGVWAFIIDAWYWDLNKHFIERAMQLAHDAFPGDLPTLPLLGWAYMLWGEQLPLELETMSVVIGLHRAVKQAFDNEHATVGDLVRVWNNLALVNQELIHCQENDTVRLPIIEEPLCPERVANPNGVTLTAILESSARAQELLYLRFLDVSPRVRLRHFDTCFSGQYRRLFDLVSTVCSNPLETERLIIRLAGISLQAPMTTCSLIESDPPRQKWENVSPTCRFNTLLQDLASEDELCARLITSRSAADYVCKRHGWQTISDSFRAFLSRPQYEGRNHVYRFLVKRHESFCNYALAASSRPVWMLDLFWETSDVKGRDDFLMSFHAPWQFRGGTVLVHPTCDPEEMLGTCFGLLANVAAHDLLFEDSLVASGELVEALCRFFAKYNMESAIRERWERVFRETFGVAMADVA